jgi:hypothetical protein
VQRTWSNNAAMTGHDPCVPALPGEVYFAAAPAMPDMVTFSSRAGSFSLPGVSVPVGQTKTIELDMFSDGNPGGAWTVKAEDAAFLRGQTSTLQLTLDRSTGLNGEKLHLTIKTLSKTTRGTATFIVSSRRNGEMNDWFGLVSEQ